ncbi:Predicted ATPase [Capnocytophaga haemolytica]|uniref:Uncharacterized conserved protein n=1 Tax=Capnocytophaga haemolytica TaxID=45243 RepID=A0AAX2GWJ8_9FLAO|nr:AAA family ATPase [Capnocytophaga haemolytica]AMD84873.1 hypothetical protein AXF12_04690 [Capnocytophaga haemolytica]SFN76897.1 Predicted ATPase [Capnocytophaga haemolytica]SNV06730.1 Uncharacterized conserved protein [Capnocytophaga haemolytica]
MRESIHIKNFGPIKDIYIEDIKPLTVLIGESGSGKSTLMKVLALFRWIYKMQNIRSYLKNSKISKSPFRFRMDTYLRNCGFVQYVKKNTEIQYTTHFGERAYTITFTQGKLRGKNEIIATEDLQYNKLSFISETRNLIPLWAEKSPSKATWGFYFQEVLNDFIDASNMLKALDIPFFNLQFAVKKEKFRTRYVVRDTANTYELDMKDSSSGIQNVIPSLLIATYFAKHFDYEEAFNRTVLNYLSQIDRLTDFKPVTNLGEVKKRISLHIEEPELSLFPDAQCELMSALVANCFKENKNEVNMVFSTHSPYIANYLNLLIKACDKGQLIKGANIRFEDLAVYQVIDGSIEDLCIKENRIVDTNSLSDTINDIYNQYEELNNQ